MTDQPPDVVVTAKRHTFKRRVLRFDFVLGSAGGTFADGTTTKPIIGMRSSVELNKAGGQSMSDCHVKILGLEQSVMWALTKQTLELTNPDTANTITISAGSEGGTLQQLYTGVIYQAWADIQAGPDVPFVIVSHEGLAQALTTAPATSVQGTGDVATVMNTLAQQMKLKFENNGITAQHSNIYLSGTLRDQAYALAAQARINIAIDDGVLAIWPVGGSRFGDPFTISPSTGMVAYPTFTSSGIILRTLFNPDIRFGGQVDVSSIEVPARGIWNIFRVGHQLDCETPGGPWFTEIECSALGHVLPQ